MAAYVIIDIEISDPDSYAQLIELVTPTVENNNGKFVARGGAIEPILGGWAPQRIAIIEFGSMDDVHAWLTAPEHVALSGKRDQSATNIKVIAVDGL
ncbi:MAG: DUF1330 domain-containing protein [Chloroflexota bacterium]|nr:DUF1330 domain-containing protein [Chloroflexota bacterium]